MIWSEGRQEESLKDADLQESGGKEIQKDVGSRQVFKNGFEICGWEVGWGDRDFE